MPTQPDDDAIRLLLTPYRGHWEITEFPASRVVTAKCGHRCWLSPQGEQLYGAPTTESLCTDCGMDLIGNPDVPKSAVPGAVEAIRAHEGDIAAQQVRRLLGYFGIEEK